MENAHENIDNELLYNTLDRIKQSSSGNWMEGLYEVMTKGGEKRKIHRASPRLATKYAWKDMDMSLMQDLINNPAFADTVKQSELGRIEENMLGMSRPGILERLLSKLF